MLGRSRRVRETHEAKLLCAETASGAGRAGATVLADAIVAGATHVGAEVELEVVVRALDVILWRRHDHIRHRAEGALL